MLSSSSLLLLSHTGQTSAALRLAPRAARGVARESSAGSQSLEVACESGQRVDARARVSDEPVYPRASQTHIGGILHYSGTQPQQ